MEEEGIEQEIILQSEYAVVGAVYSVNGYTGHVVLKTSDLENDSDYQTGTDVAGAISTHNSNEEAHPYIQGQIETKQDKLTAGANVQISDQNVISATDTTYTQGNGINISDQNAISVNTTVVATQQNLSDEVTNRENADIYLQGQIDAISASSDVVDIVGTYADLQNYDTQHLKDNDIIKVLQDETQGNATTYYRWSTATQTFTLIGQEGPYYTKAGADAQFVPQTRTVNSKALSSNITLTASDVSAVGTGDVVQTTGTSTTQIMSQKATTDALATKLNITDYVVDDHLANTTNPVQNQVLNGLIGSMPSNFFTGEATTTGTGSDIALTGTIKAPLASMQMLGDTYQQTYSGKNLWDFNGLPNKNYMGANLTINEVFDGGAVVTGNTSASAVDSAYSKGWFGPAVSEDNASKRIQLNGGETFTISADVTILETGYSNTIYIGRYLGTVNKGFGQGNTLTVGVKTRISSTFTASESGGYSPYVTLSSCKVKIENLQFEKNSTETSYEPYTGGIPAPNPDYPQDIQVVTGEQTVTITDGGEESQEYTVNLGSLELCKIGDYQDYIYKSGDDWYVHKTIGKVVLNGSESWTVQPRITSAWNTSKPSTLATGETRLLSNYFSEFKTSVTALVGSGIVVGGALNIRNITVTDGDTAEFKTWLSNHNTVIYYPSTTSTDTQITDAGLVTELTALWEANSYNDNTYLTVTATGTNLPAVLSVGAYTKTLNGILGAIGTLN